MSFIGIANNIWRDTPGVGGGTSIPPWVLRADSLPATLDIDFVNNRAWLSPNLTTVAALLSCSRATPAAAYYTKADGTLTTFAANTVRYGTNGLLVEESRTNILLQSQDYTTVSWTKAQITATAAVTTAPDGTATGNKLTEDTSNNIHRITAAAISKATSAITYTFTAYAKLNGRRLLMALDDTSGNGALSVFDLAGSQIGVAATTYGGAPFSSPSSSITALANGWFRCQLIATSNSAANLTGLFGLDNGTGTGALSQSYLGDGVSGVYLWGADIETGGFATSYIPTTTVSVTRAADEVSIALNPWFSTIANTIYTQVDNTGGEAGMASYTTVLGTDNSNGSPHIALNIGGFAVYGAIWGNALSVTSNNTVTLPGAAKIAYAFTSGSSNTAVNGVASTNNTNAITIVNNTTGYLGNRGIDDGNSALNGYLKRFASFNFRASNAALQTLTT